RDLFDDLGLCQFLHATRGRGFHVGAPLDASADFDTVRALASDAAECLAGADPDQLTTAQRKDKRGHRVFLDTNRNGYGQTFVAPYSLRSRPGATVATPLDWSELGNAAPNGWNPTKLRQRLAQKPDPWRDIYRHATAAEKARQKLNTLR
ncbi:MAG: non-homologous end-joining DNA ligase, partial [Sciscionella sp.]